MVLFRPSAQSMKVDVAAGYKLGINLGLVTEIVNLKQVRLWWMFPVDGSWKGRWRPWERTKTEQKKLKVGARYSEVVQVKDLLEDAQQQLANVKMGRKKSYWNITPTSFNGVLAETVRPYCRKYNLKDEWA